MTVALKLVENNLHQVEVQGRHMLFHTPSSALFETDQLTRDVISCLRGQANQTSDSVTQVLCPRYPADDLQRVLGELQALELLVSPGEEGRPSKPLELENVPLTTVVLNVNTGCNLSCSYCYKEDLDVPSAGKKMSFETARQSIESRCGTSAGETRPAGSLSPTRNASTTGP